MENLGWRDLLIFWGVVVAIILGGMALGYAAEDRQRLSFWEASSYTMLETGQVIAEHTTMPSELACRRKVAAQRVVAQKMRDAQLGHDRLNPVRAIFVSCRQIRLDIIIADRGA